MKNVMLTLSALVITFGFIGAAQAKGTPEQKAARKEARKECLAGDANLKGKELHSCVKGKLHAKKDAAPAASAVAPVTK